MQQETDYNIAKSIIIKKDITRFIEIKELLIFS